MMLRKIQRKVASGMNVNVNMTKRKRAKKMVKNKLARNFVEEFAMLWDYADKLRLKNPRSIIKMTVNRVTPECPLYFKRFYVFFEALKRGWKEGCRPILGLDDCFLKDVANELFSKNLKVWTKAFQGLHSVLDIIDNNLCEAFNSSIVESKFKSIITMLEEINRIEPAVVEAGNYLGSLVPILALLYDILNKNLMTTYI
ncbi:hypothetical protein Gotri_012966, partial [Gossypium trilobum]|nr:hypothetical protein [Gossypium trilobum]